MASKFIPSQNRYFDPYHQRLNSGTSGTDGLDPINTSYPQKYLSRISNQQLLKAIGNNMVLNGLELSTSFVGPNAYIVLSAGKLIADYTVIELPSASNLDFSVSSYGDTPNTNSRLVVFSNFQYLETPDTDTQTSLVLTVYHVNSTGLVVSGNPGFNATRNKILLAIIDFTKVGSNITSISKSSLTSLNILGTVYYSKGSNNTVMSDFFTSVLGTAGTSATSGTTATSGTSNFGTPGTSGTSNVETPGTSGVSGTSGTTGTAGTSGSSCEISSGTSGTDGTNGTDNANSGTSGLTVDLTSNEVKIPIFLSGSL